MSFGEDPPGWDRPQPTQIILGAQTVGCDRCGVVVHDWDLHSEYHATLAKDGAVRTAMTAIADVAPADWSPEIRAQIEWAKREAGL